MNLQEVVNRMHLTVRTGADHLDRTVTGGYAGDLMSDVIAHGNPGNLWVTMQVHVNIVAVAVLKDLAAILIIQGREPDADTLQRAAEENVAILIGDLPAFIACGQLYDLLQGEAS